MGICVVTSVNYGGKNNSVSILLERMIVAALERLLGRENFDIVGVKDIQAARNLTQPDATHPNAPYHSFLHAYFKLYGDDYGDHYAASRAVMNADANGTVHHYLLARQNYNDEVSTYWPGINAAEYGGGCNPNGSNSYKADVTEYLSYEADIGGQTLRCFSNADAISAVPPGNEEVVKPIFVNSQGYFLSWTYRDTIHIFPEWGLTDWATQSTAWWNFLLYAIYHMNVPIRPTLVRVDVDDLFRSDISGWYSRIEADPSVLGKFTESCARNGFGKPNFAHEASLGALYGAPRTLDAMRRLKSRSTPHSHVPEGNIKLPTNFANKDEALACLNESYANFNAVGLTPDMSYITWPANYATRYALDAAGELGIALSRGGTWVGASDASGQPFGCIFDPRGFWRTGIYGGHITSASLGGQSRYGWNALAGAFYPSQGDGVNHAKAVAMRTFMATLLLGDPTIPPSGYPNRTSTSRKAVLVFHPDNLADDVCGADTLDWIGAWGKLVPFYKAEEDARAFAV